jgi:two-component sensor histidine kinase
MIPGQLLGRRSLLRRFGQFVAEHELLRERPTVGYAAAFALVSTAIGIRLALGDLLSGVYYLTIFPAVALSAIIGGARAGALALVAGGVGARFFLIPPIYSFRLPELPDALSLVLYIAVAGVLVVFIASLAVSAKDNAQLAARNAALARQRELLLREVHHRVKNNLQMIASMVRITSHKSRPDVRPQLEDLTRRIAAIGHLYDYVPLADDPGRLDMAKYVKQVCTSTSSAFDRAGIKLRLDIEPMASTIDTALPVGLVASELVTNAYKHAFPNGAQGELLVRLKRHEGTGVLTVRDQGIGFDGADRDGSMGLKLVRALAAQVDGRLSAKNRPDGGAQFRLKFKVSETGPEGRHSGTK